MKWGRSRPFSRRRRTTPMPSRPGICTSRITTSGCSRGIISRASRPLEPLAITSTSGKSWSRNASSSQASCSSSTTIVVRVAVARSLMKLVLYHFEFQGDRHCPPRSTEVRLYCAHGGAHTHPGLDSCGKSLYLLKDAGTAGEMLCGGGASHCVGAYEGTGNRGNSIHRPEPGGRAGEGGARRRGPP